MADKRAVLAQLQRIADEGKENQLSGQIRQLFDAAVKEGLIQARQGMMGAIQEAVSPRFQEDFPEVELALNMPTDPAEAQRYIDELSASPMVEAGRGLMGKYAGARITEDRYGRPIVETPSGEKRYLNRGGFSVGDIPRAVRGTLGFVEEAAPYLTGGGAARPAVQVGYQGLVGLGTEAVKQAERAMGGEEVAPSRLATTPLMVMAGDLLGRGVFRVGAKVYNRLTGKPAAAATQVIDENTGQFKQEAVREMRQNASSQDIDNQIFNTMVDEAESGALNAEQMQQFARVMDEYITSGQATPAQMERYNMFRRMGLEPTRAQVTRTADDFTVQQDLAKETGAVTAALSQQQQQLRRAFETAEAKTGGTVRSEIAPLQQAVVDKAVKLDNEISALYTKAEESFPDAPVIDIRGYISRLLENKIFNQKSGGTYAALVGQVKRDFGVDLNKLNEPVLVTPKQAEVIRQTANDLYAPNVALDGTASTSNKIIREVKEALDEDVANALGKDAYKSARNAYQEFRRGLDPEQLSKFSRNQKSLIRDLLEERIPAERVFERVVASKGYTAKDLRALKNYIVGRKGTINDAGAAAWKDLKAETISYIRNNAFIGPLDELGGQTLSRATLQKILNDRIGRDKLKVIFNPEELKFLDDVLAVSRLIEPIGGKLAGSGISGQAVQQLERTVRGLGGRVSQGLLDMAGSVIKSARQAAAERTALSGAAPIVERVVEEAVKIGPRVGAAGGATGRVTAATLNEEMR